MCAYQHACTYVHLYGGQRAIYSSILQGLSTLIFFFSKMGSPIRPGFWPVSPGDLPISTSSVLGLQSVCWHTQVFLFAMNSEVRTMSAMLQGRPSLTEPSPRTIWLSDLLPFFSHLAIFLLPLFSCEFLGRMVHSCNQLEEEGSGVQGSLWLLSEFEASMSSMIACPKEQNKTAKSNIQPQHSFCSCPEFTEWMHHSALIQTLCVRLPSLNLGYFSCFSSSA